MTVWEGVDLVQHWFVHQHATVSIRMRDSSPALIVTVNCLGVLWKWLVRGRIWDG